ncbi:MAG: glycosyltransferase [Acidobacteriota bacterium]
MTSSSQAVRVLFGSGSPELIEATLARWSSELPLVVVSEFPPKTGEWIPFHLHRRPEDNRQLVASRLAGREMREGAILLDPANPHESLRELGREMLGVRITWFDATGPTTWGRYLSRERKQNLRANKDKLLRLLNPQELQLTFHYRKAIRRGQQLVERRRVATTFTADKKPEGISVIIPSRNGRDLLERCLPGLAPATEIIVVDNGSNDGTAEWLAREYPHILVEHSAEALPFSTAMNRGIRRSNYAYICALNNDMLVEPGFLDALRDAFERVPNLFCSSAQIFLPEGQRREETGKTVFQLDPGVADLPMRCDIPLEGEDLTYVPYGSGGCSMYDAAKLGTIDGFDESYKPAYVEDLDLGLRGWAHGWPSVYCANARVLHQHRTTTSKYFTEADLDLILEVNYLRFLVRMFAPADLFLRFWNHAILRLKALGKSKALAAAAHMASAPVTNLDRDLLPLFSGDIAVFPARPRSGKPVVLIASPYLPFPLAHGAAVRIYNLLREAARDFDVVLLAFVETPQTMPRELLDLCVEIVSVWRPGMHTFPDRGRPDTVEEFDRPTFHAALRQTIAKWSPQIVQLEFTQMAAYVADCGSAPVLLVEHDITYDLYAQLLARPDTNDWETGRQHARWLTFEHEAWRNVTRVVTMSEKDRAVVNEKDNNDKAIAIGNGVDLERFQPSNATPDPRRLLFIGSFAHKPNVLALEFFLREVFPRLIDVTLHVIAGRDHTRFWDLKHPGVEVEGFVSDVRPAYRQATLVIAPLVASAGTNVKIVEAMAMGKAIVSTDAGIHGLELDRDKDVLVENDPSALAAAITGLLENPAARRELEQHARSTAERVYGWPAMGRVQKELYESLL